MKKINKGQMIEQLDLLINNAVMSPKLVEVVKETRKALEQDKLDLATELSSIKRNICDGMEKLKLPNEECRYAEDGAKNEKILKDTAYGILGQVHFDLSMGLGKIPSGMAVVTGTGYHTEKPEKLPNPVLQDYHEWHDKDMRLKLKEWEQEDKSKGIDINSPSYEKKRKSYKQILNLD